MYSRWSRGSTPPATRDELLDDYVAAEDALRAFTDRNFGRLCATCARWTIFAARANAAQAADTTPSVTGRRTSWRLQSWVTNCCNADHALESMSEISLAGIVASRAEGRAWWRKIQRSAEASCSGLTDGGCSLRRGRPELCNRYFCEAVRDYLWLLGGDRAGPGLASRLDDFQRRWARLYAGYQSAVSCTQPQDESTAAGKSTRAEVRRATGWVAFFTALQTFDREIAQYVRPLVPAELTGRLFKVQGDSALYEPFFAREVEAIGGEIRVPDAPPDS